MRRRTGGQTSSVSSIVAGGGLFRALGPSSRLPGIASEALGPVHWVISPPQVQELRLDLRRRCSLLGSRVVVGQGGGEGGGGGGFEWDSSCHIPQSV
eukprot:3213582-Pyramimonas_sp.AAC.1